MEVRIGPQRILVIGGGIGGLVAALDLARQGVDVTLLERAAALGGKMRRVTVDGRQLDAGPTVFTMRHVFDSIFADAGTSVDAHLTLRPASVLARHAWSDTARLDLFADTARSAEAIGDFAGAAEARGFLAFCAQARRVYQTLDTTFIQGALPTPFSLARRVGNLGDLLAIKPFQSMWSAIGDHLHDPRLRQLFGRYATYCGSSPFLAPATLMLVAHVEQQGVWLVEGGMHRLAAALADLVRANGATIRLEAPVDEVLVTAGRASGVRLASGETLAADAVVVNADPAALAAGLLGGPVRTATPSMPPETRSLSALTWATVAHAEGFPLLRHNVFFSHDYAAEFADLAQERLPGNPTVYICAQDRDDTDTPPDGPERLLCLVNAPAIGDRRGLTPAEIAECTERSFALLRRCGLTLHRKETVITGPADFHRLFPGTGGALYGPAVHGSMATFRRPGSRTKIPGLYLAGGSTHPGAGVPMAALSGRLAASALMADRDSMRRSRPMAMSGGMSTR